jgi:hypothetical protein
MKKSNMTKKMNAIQINLKSNENSKSKIYKKNDSKQMISSKNFTFKKLKQKFNVKFTKRPKIKSKLDKKSLINKSAKISKIKSKKIDGILNKTRNKFKKFQYNFKHNLNDKVQRIESLKLASDTSKIRIKSDMKIVSLNNPINSQENRLVISRNEFIEKPNKNLRLKMSKMKSALFSKKPIKLNRNKSKIDYNKNLYLSMGNFMIKSNFQTNQSIRNTKNLLSDYTKKFKNLLKNSKFKRFNNPKKFGSKRFRNKKHKIQCSSLDLTHQKLEYKNIFTSIDKPNKNDKMKVCNKYSNADKISKLTNLNSSPVTIKMFPDTKMYTSSFKSENKKRLKNSIIMSSLDFKHKLKNLMLKKTKKLKPFTMRSKSFNYI